MRFFLLFVTVLNSGVFTIITGQEETTTENIGNVTDEDYLNPADYEWPDSVRVYGDSANTKRLAHHLLDLYNTLEMPIANFSDPLKITVGLKLLAVTKVSELENAIQTNMLLSLSWHDRNMIWLPFEFANLTSIQVPKHRIWSPDIRVLNQYGDQFDPTEATQNVVKHDGTITRIVPGHFTTVCPLSIQDYPFEDHKCTIKIGTWSSDKTEIVLLLKNEMDENLHVHPHINWEVTAFYGNRGTLDDSSTSKSYVTYELHVRRKGMAIFNTACAMNFLICMLIFVSVLMPPSSYKIHVGMFGIIVCYLVEMRFHILCFGLEDGDPPRLAVYFETLLMVNLACLVTNAVTVWISCCKSKMPSAIKSVVIKLLPILKSVHSIRPPLELTTDENTQNCNGVRTLGPKNTDRLESQEVPEKCSLGKVDDCICTRRVGHWDNLGIVLDRLFFGFWIVFMLLFTTIAFPSFSK